MPESAAPVLLAHSFICNVHQEYEMCRDNPTLHGLRAYIAGCMSGRGAMAGAGCGITCRCSMATS